MAWKKTCWLRFGLQAALAMSAACGDASSRTQPTPTEPSRTVGATDDDVDILLRRYLAQHGFTGRVGESLEARLGRRVDPQLADIGRLLWFDPITALNGDNACAGCHSPTNGFGDTQSIAIGIDNNRVVGPQRQGPRNQRRSPMILNAAFFPSLMWNSRFRALSENPFDNSRGFQFPDPEARSLSYLPHLLAAQAFIPPTERVEAAGFHILGDNDALRREVLRRINEVAEYRARFSRAFSEIKAGALISFDHLGRAIAEFEFTQVYADAPLDRFAHGEPNAMTASEKRGAILFFGDAGCVRCHAVSGRSNEMFSDFREHVIGVPQVVPTIGNVTFDGPGANEDFGLEQVTSNAADRYAFRTSPLRNVALQPTFMHNGAFVRLEDAVRHHLDVVGSIQKYSTSQLASDLRGALGPSAPVLARLDPRLSAPLSLSGAEFQDLVAFVRDGLLDPAAEPDRLRRLIPEKLPSGLPLFTFEFKANVGAASRLLDIASFTASPSSKLVSLQR
jgi:cytochrome c peroxidase